MHQDIDVVLVSRGWFPTTKGGAEKFISRLGNELYKRGLKVVGITQWVRNAFYPKTPYKIIFISGKGKPNTLSSLVFSLKAGITVNKLKPCAVIVNGYWGELAPLFIKSSKIVTIIHDVGFVNSIYQSKLHYNTIKNIMRKYILSKIIKKSDIIVVPSLIVKKDIINYISSYCTEKIYVLGFEGIDGPFRRIHVENEYFDIVHVARFAPNKGHIILLKAFANILNELKNIRLWLVGGIDAKHIDYYEKIKYIANNINRKFNKPVVKIVTNAPSLNNYYALADVCVAPSIGDEGYGLAVAECMAYGKPVIASDIFADTGVVSAERAFVVERGDPYALANTIKYVYLNYEEALKKADKGLEFARKCSWSKVADKFIELLRHVNCK
ncbi:glycosyltransferase [Pyrodictium abyssi]|uniref:Glycosyltransferase subfamily 4-like N-terminal domain-containing protein n=1 Tax=Pyrodictium abyssi TaxID=54256 RepID=A0ABM8IXW9_9CREN|nr:hypothetical protein PABY_19450 [Pyrodictium abyssi]